LAISDSATFLPCSIAPFTPLSTTSSKNSTSRINDFLIDLDRNDFAGAVGHDLHLPAAGFDLNRLLGQFGLGSRHLLLHLLRLLHQFVYVHGFASLNR